MSQRAAEKNSAQHAIIQTDMQQWRLKLLNGMMIVIFAITSVLVLLGSINIMNTRPEYGTVAITFFMISYTLIGINTFVRRLPYVLRVVILLAILYVVECYDIFIYGLASDGRLYAISISVLATLLLGIRPGVFVTVIAVGSIAILGGFVHRWVLTPLDSTPNLTLWITQVFSQALHNMVLVVGAAVLLHQLSNALISSRIALQQAGASAEEAQQQATALVAQTKLLEETQEQLRNLVVTLETPTVELADRVLLAPLTGIIDARRAQSITERLLHKVHASSTRLIILDLAGMSTAEAVSIRALETTANALQLLGCRVIFTSLSASLAQSFRQTSTAFHTLEFRRSPQEVLASEVFKL